MWRDDLAVVVVVVVVVPSTSVMIVYGGGSKSDASSGQVQAEMRNVAIWRVYLPVALVLDTGCRRVFLDLAEF